MYLEKQVLLLFLMATAFRSFREEATKVKKVFATYSLLALVVFALLLAMAGTSSANTTDWAHHGNLDDTVWNDGNMNGTDCQCDGVIGDYVWHDLYHDQNHIVDGLQDAGEPGIEGVIIELYDSDGNFYKSVTTDADGFYQFTGLSYDSYTVKVADSNFETGGALDGWYAAPPDEGNDESRDSDGDRDNHEVAVYLCEQSTHNDVDFGFITTGIDLVKTGPGTTSLGDDITYHFRVENTGDVVLHAGAHVYDELIEPEGNHEIWSGVVYPGEVKEFDRTYTPEQDDCGDLTNIANAVGYPRYPDGSYLDEVTDEDSWTTQVQCGTASLGDYVWYDTNGDGIQDADEIGLSDVSVRLFADDGDGIFEPGADDSLLKEMTTDGDGNYDFTHLAAGDYWVDVSDENASSGSVLTTNNDPLLVKLADGQNFDEADFGYQELANSTCVVIQRPGDTHEDVLDAYIWAASPDNNSGNSETLYTGMVGDGEKRSLLWFDLDGVPSGSVIDSAAFGIYVRSSQSQVVRAHRITNAWDETTVTWNNFNNGFANETEGYLLSDSSGFHYIDLTELVQGWWSGAYDNSGILLEENLDTYDTYKSSEYGTAAYRPELVVCYHAPSARIGDLVWNDANADGLQDSGESGVSGVTASLYANGSCSGSAQATDTTDDSGIYSFTNLAPGTYSVKFTAPGGYVFSPANQGSDDEKDSNADVSSGCTGAIALADGAEAMGWDAGLYQPIDLSLVKTISDIHPHIGDNVSFAITITNSGPGAATGVAVTDQLPSGYTYVSDDGSGAYDSSTGVWNVGDLAVGAEVTLQIVARVNDSGNFLNWAEVSAADQMDVDSDPAIGPAVDDYDDDVADDDEASAGPSAGVLGNSGIGDRVWWDIDGNGRQDAGEPGIPGVIVSLADGITLQTTTDDNGLYHFDSLDADVYTVTVDSSNFASGGPLADWIASPRDVGADDSDSDGDESTHDVSVPLALNQTQNTIDFGFDIPSSYTLTKQLTTASWVRPGAVVKFTIRITNTGKSWIDALPMRDNYDTTYLTYGNGGAFATPDSDDHVNDGVLDWSDVLNGHPLAPNESVSITVSFTSLADTTQLPDGRTKNTATVYGAMADPDGPDGPLDALEPLEEASSSDVVGIVDPTGLILASVNAEAADGRVHLCWQTVSELSVAGFRALRLSGEDSVRVADVDLVFAQHPGMDQGATYCLVDDHVLPGQRYRYQLELVKLDGSQQLVDPVDVLVSGAKLYIPSIWH